MIWQGWVFLGAVALLATWGGFSARSDDAAILSAGIGFFGWGLFSFQSLYVVVMSNGTAAEFTYEPIAAWGLLMAVANLYILITGPIDLIDQRQRASETP